MVRSVWVTFAAIAVTIPLGFAAAFHNVGCIPGRADPASYMLLDTLFPLDGGEPSRFYLEERASPLVLPVGVPTPLWPTGSVPLPLTGFLVGPGPALPYGHGTWFYEETNSVDSPVLGSLQRGGVGATGDCFPAPPAPCILVGEDPIVDPSCAHGPDNLIWSLYLNPDLLPLN